MNSAIVLVADRLSAGYLGPYGMTWADTPQLNRLASEAVLYEFAIADSPQLASLYRGYWHGLHAGDPAAELPEALPARLSHAGLRTALLTDDAEVAGHPTAAQFDEQIKLEASRADDSVDALEQTHFAQLIAAGLEWLERAEPPFLLWLHARALAAPWDAPWQLRQRFVAEDDPLPPEWVEPPQLELAADYDPDQLLGIMHAYAGQVVALDACVGALLDAVAASTRAGSTALLFTSPRGYPLGEHRRVGPFEGALYEELLHVPLLVRPPGGRGRLQREHQLTHSADIYATLLECVTGRSDELPEAARVLPPLGQGSRPAAPRDRVCSFGTSARAIRTPAWFLRQPLEGAAELFVKPDDRWEANEIADRAAEVVEELLETLDQYEQALQSRQLSQLPPLSDLLAKGVP